MAMKVSIITPSFNQAKYIDRTLRGVISQKYQNIEHIVLDPGSSDGSIKIIEEYVKQNNKSKFINEPDTGQVDAINRGLTIATGEVVTWLNTDDFYLNDSVIDKVVAVFIDNPDIDVVYAKGHYVDQEGNYLKPAYVNKEEKQLKQNLSHSIGILQPALFFKKSLFERIGGLDDFYNLSLDYEYWLRMAFGGAQMKYLNEEIVGATLHDESKTQGQRGFQYYEICVLMKQYYGFVHISWLERFANYLHDGSDGIININKDCQTETKHIFNSLFRRWNGTAESLYRVVNQNELLHTNEFIDYCRETESFLTQRVVVTTASSEYYNQLLNLIAGLHRTSLSDFDLIIIYDLDFTDEQREHLYKLEKVYVAPYKKEHYFSEYYNPKSYVYKCEAIGAALDILQDNDMLLWVDSGVVPLRSIRELFELVSDRDAFFVNHDDRVDQHFCNVNFTHQTALFEMAANSSEAMGEHICSCLMGCKKNGRYENIFREAFEFSKNRKISWWPKHLSEEDNQKKILSKNEISLKHDLINNAASASESSLQEVINVFEYWGHRQDQSIYSILVSRYSAPIISAKNYCVSTDDSSAASYNNWKSGGEWKDINRHDSPPSEVTHALSYHHRGTFNDLRGLCSKSIATMTDFTDPVSGEKLSIKPVKNIISDPAH